MGKFLRLDILAGNVVLGHPPQPTPNLEGEIAYHDFDVHVNVRYSFPMFIEASELVVGRIHKMLSCTISHE